MIFCRSSDFFRVTDIEEKSAEQRSDFAAVKALSALVKVNANYTFASTNQNDDSDEIDITEAENEGEETREANEDDGSNIETHPKFLPTTSIYFRQVLRCSLVGLKRDPFHDRNSVVEKCVHVCNRAFKQA